MFSQQAAAARQNWTPLITEYTNKVMRWVRIAIVLGVLAFAAWLAFQIFAQASLFDWIGERIDNITDQDSSALRRLDPKCGANRRAERDICTIFRMMRTAQAPSWTQTGTPIGITPLSQIQSIAGTLTRTQPCEAG